MPTAEEAMPPTDAAHGAEGAGAPAAALRSFMRNPFTSSRAADASTPPPPATEAPSSSSRTSPPKSRSPGGGKRFFNITLPLNKITKDIENDGGAIADRSYLTAGRSTPFRPGLVKCVTDRWTDTHASVSQMLLEQPPPDPISHERVSARIQSPSFDKRRAMLEEGLAHLPSQWQA